jgi:hypothetical protein
VVDGLDINPRTQIVETDMTSLLCIAEALEALVLIVGGRGTEHQNAQTRKIFSCLLLTLGIFWDSEQVGGAAAGNCFLFVCNW